MDEFVNMSINPIDTNQQSVNKNIVIIDYISERNRGDAAIQAGLIKILQQRFPNSVLSAISVFGANQFPALESEYSQSVSMGLKIIGGLLTTFYPVSQTWNKSNLFFEFRNFIGLIQRLTLLLALKLKIHPQSLFHFISKKYHPTLKCILEADLVIIRGRNYRDRKTAALEVVRMLAKTYHLLLCSLLSKNMVLVGASVWNLKSNLARKILGHAFQDCKFITVRDENSLIELKNIAGEYGFNDPILLPDLSFAAFDDRQSIIKNRKTTSPSEHPETIGLTIVDWKDCGQVIRNKYLTSIVQLISHFSKLGSKIIIIPQVSVAWENTRGMVHEILQSVDNENVTVVSGEPSINDLLKLYSNLDILIATRMHSAIFAVSVNTPIIAIPYDKGGKWNIVEELGYKDYIINYDEITAEKLLQKTLDCWKNKEVLVSHAEKMVNSNIEKVNILAEMLKF